MKRLLCGVLMMVCSVSWAEWELCVISDDGIITIYCDKSTIRKKGAISRMWDLVDFSIVQTPSGYRYMSDKAFWAYNCREETMAVISVTWYSGAMGGGNVVFFGTRQERDWEWQPVSPGTAGEAKWKIACGKK